MLKPKGKFHFPFNHFLLLRFSFFLFPFAILYLPCHSQVLDSIRTSLHTRPDLTGGFGTNTSFINGYVSPVFNIYGGLDFNHHIRTGIGLSWLQLASYNKRRDNTPFYLDKMIANPQGKTDTVHSALNFKYFDWYVEYIFYKSKRWQFSVPLQLGIGNSYYTYSYNGTTVAENKHLVFLYQPAISGYYRILNWFGVGLDVGYRFMLVNNRTISDKFNSPIYNAYAIIFWDELYKMFFPKTKSAKKIGG